MNLIKELEAWGNTQVLWEKSIDIDWKRFDEILSRAKAEQAKENAPNNMADILADALIWASGTNDFQEGGKAREGWLKIGRPAISAWLDSKKNPAPSPVEPLAVLADRKGLSIGHIGTHKDTRWAIMLISTSLWSKGKGTTMICKTYAEAESKARQYLNGLPDKKGDK